MPAEIVPVVDVLAKNDDLSVLNGLIVVEFSEQGIRGRTAGTTL